MVSGLVWWSPLISFWWGASSTDWHWPLGGDEDEDVIIDNIHNHKCVCGWGWWWEWILKIGWETQVSRQQKCKITFLVNCFFVELYLLVHDLSLPCFWSMFQKNRKKHGSSALLWHFFRTTITLIFDFPLVVQVAKVAISLSEQLPQNTTKNNPKESSSFHQIDRDKKTNLPNFPLLRYLFSLCLIYIYPCVSHHI